MTTGDKVHVFWDNSNIFIPARYVASRKDGVYAEPHVRVHFDKLFRLAQGGREVASAVCVGSVPPQLQAVWDRLRATGVEVSDGRCVADILALL